jgi:nitrogen fixation NifU-like protein
MTEAVKGKAVDEIERMFEGFRDALTVRQPDGQTVRLPGRLEALRGVTRFPMRVKCATLAWHALHKALSEYK